MSLMVQDLTNPMIAQIPHCLLASHVGTIMGVETNAMQFYPEASAPEAAMHPGSVLLEIGSDIRHVLRGHVQLPRRQHQGPPQPLFRSD